MTETMQTTCPSCHAVFRVKPVQLEAHAGKVRCGKCAYVFNAFDTLVTPIETFSLMAAPADDFDDEHEVAAAGSTAEISQIVVHDVRPMTISEPISVTFPIPTDDQIEREAEAINREIAASAHPELIEELGEISDTDEPPKSGLHITPELHEKLNHLQQQLSTQEKHARWRGAVWGSGIILCVLLLAIQSVYHFRNQISAYYPQTHAALSTLCVVLNCHVELLANAELIKLESSELQSLPDQPGGVALIASLRNLATYRQAYPHLELTLTDGSKQTLARRQFTPADYLPPKLKAETGMTPQDELPIKLTLELLGMEAVGYKLLVFYP